MALIVCVLVLGLGRRREGGRQQAAGGWGLGKAWFPGYTRKSLAIPWFGEIALVSLCFAAAEPCCACRVGCVLYKQHKHRVLALVL